MKAAESKEGKRTLSACDDEESAAKRNKKQYPKITGKKDVFCWTCHRPGNGNVGIATCSECPRAYHLKCGHLGRVPEPSEKWICPECDTVQRADKQAPSSPTYMSTFSKLMSFVLERVKRVDGVENFSTPVDTNKWHDYLDYVIQPMDLPKLKSNIDANKYRSVDGFLADFRWLVHASYVYNSVHSVYTKIAKSMMNVAKQECEEVKNCSECYMHACTLGDNWFVEPCTIPHILVWAQLSGFPYWPAKVMRQMNGDIIDVRFFGDHTRANVPITSCFLYSRVIPCSVRGKKHSSKITTGIEEAELYVKNIKLTYKEFCYAQYRVPYLPKEEECIRKLQLPEYPIDNETPEFLNKVETLRKEKMIEDKEFHSEMKKIISEQEKSKRPSLPLKRKSSDAGSKLMEMKKKLVKIDTPQGQKFAIMNMSGSESDSSPKHVSSQLKSPVVSIKPIAKPSVSGTSVQPEMNGVHNSSKTPSKVDDETIKQVLARSPKEVSPNSLSPQGDSGILESLSRKLFTSPKKVLVNVSEKNGQVTRSQSQRLSTPKLQEPLESDSDSDALVIAEDSPTESPDEKIKAPPTDDTKSQVGKASSPPEATKLYLKIRPSEKQQMDLQLGPRILIRKAYIPSEKCLPPNQMLPALPAIAGRNETLPISERRPAIVHKALPPNVSEAKDTVSKRTRRSLKIDAASGAVKKDGVFQNESQYKKPEPTEIMPMNKKPRRPSKEASESKCDIPSKTDCEPAESAVIPPAESAVIPLSADAIVSQAEEEKSKIVPARTKRSMSPLVSSSNKANEPKTDETTKCEEPSKTDSEPATSATNSSAGDVSSPAGEAATDAPHKSDTENSHSTPNSPPGDISSPAIEEKAMLASKKPRRPSTESEELSTEALHRDDSEHAQSATDSSAGEISSPSKEKSMEEKSMIASKNPRRLFKESHLLSTDVPHETDNELTPSAITQPSTGDISSLAVEEKSSIELKNEEPRRPLLEKCEPEADNSCETDVEPIVNSNCDTKGVDSLCSESKSIESGSSTSSTRSIPAESTLVLSLTSSLPEDSNVPCAEKNREQLDQLISQDSTNHLVKDRPVTPVSLPRNADSADGLPCQTEKDVQTITPMRSVICHSTDDSPASVNSPASLNSPEPITPVRSVIRHSTDDSPVSVNSPESSSVTSSPEGSVLMFNAAYKVPASMEVPVIKVVRTQYAIPEEEKMQSCSKSSQPKVASVEVAAEPSSDITPVEENDNQVDAANVPHAASEAKVVQGTSSGASTPSTVPISVGEENVEHSSQEAADSSSDSTQEKSAEVGLSEMEVTGSQKAPNILSSLDMLDGDLSHLYEDLELPEEDNESDEPVDSEPIAEDEAASSEGVGVSSKTVESQKDAQKDDSAREPQDHPSSEDVEPTAMGCDDISPVDAREVTELEKMAGTETPTSSNGSIVESALALQPVAELPVETKTVEETQPIPRPSLEGEKCGLGKPSPGLMDPVPQPTIDSLRVTEAEIPATSETATAKPLPKNASSNDLSSIPEKAVKPLSPHTSDKNNGKCTCIMCHVAHPGASFDKTVEDYHMMKSIELCEPKRGHSKETEAFSNRLRENTAFVTVEEAAESGSQEAAQSAAQDAVRQSYNDEHNHGSYTIKRNSFNSLEQGPVSISSLALKRSSDSLEAGPSSGKPSRPLPGLVTLTKEVVQRRLSSEQNSPSENNSFGGLQISSSMSLNPSAVLQLSSKSPADKSNVEARKTPMGKGSTAAPEPHGGNESKKATQNATTMPLPIIIKPDPDGNEVPEVPKNQVPPTPPKPNIKLKHMSTLLERPPPPPSPKQPESSNRNECTTPKFNMVPPFEPKKTLGDVRKLIESKSQFISAKLKKDIYTLFDQIQSDYDSHMELLEHIADASLNTVETTLESNKNLVFEEMKTRLRKQVDAHIADIKKKQWCILCGNEAAFHCCWGYNYCCEDCQKADWPEHTKVCTQYNMTATDPYIRASPRFKALLEKQMMSGSSKKILVQDLIDIPVAVSVQSSPPGKGKPTPLKGRKILAGPRTTLLESDLSATPDSPNIPSFAIPALAKTSAAPTPSIQRISDQVTSYKIIQPGRTVRIINPPPQRPPQRLPQVVQKPQVAAKAVPRPVVSSPSRDFNQSGKIAARLTTLGQWGSVKLPPSLEVSRTPVTSSPGIQRKQVMASGRIIPSPQSKSTTSFLRVMDDQEIASILQRNHLSDY